MNAQRFFYVCAGILMLVIAIAVRAQKVVAQSGTAQFAGIAVTPTSQALAITTSGDVYARAANVVCNNGTMSWQGYGGAGPCGNDPGWQFIGNVLAGSVAVDGKTWTGVKQDFRR